MNRAGAVVEGLLTALRNNDMVFARTAWADSAVWHVTGSHRWAGDYGPDGFLALVQEWLDEHPSYVAESDRPRPIGEDVVTVTVESSDGEAPGRASGLLVFRVVGARITEGWAIPTFAGGRYAF